MERILASDMDLHADQLLVILNQPRMIQQTPTRLPSYQQIEIAIFAGFTASHGAGHA